MVSTGGEEEATLGIPGCWGGQPGKVGKSVWGIADGTEGNPSDGGCCGGKEKPRALSPPVAPASSPKPSSSEKYKINTRLNNQC